MTKALDPQTGKTTNFTNIRSILLDKKRRTNTAWFDVVLKPSRDHTYGNTVNILDEMKIYDIHRYVLTDITPYELQLMRSKP